MNIIINLIVAVILVSWIVTISVFSIQNITLVSLKFAFFESIKIPLGVLLTLSAGTGMILGAIAPLLLPRRRASSRRSFASRNTDDLEEFDF